MFDHSGDISYPTPGSNQWYFPRNNDPTKKISSKQHVFVFHLQTYSSRRCVDTVSCFAISCFSFQTHFQTECHQRCSSTVENRKGRCINSATVMFLHQAIIPANLRINDNLSKYKFRLGRKVKAKRKRKWKLICWKCNCWRWKLGWGSLETRWTRLYLRFTTLVRLQIQTLNSDQPPLYCM